MTQQLTQLSIEDIRTPEYPLADMARIEWQLDVAKGAAVQAAVI
jgi:hypothetical protein